ncbi:hypothetical protein KIN20_029064 [Parelaphostrongylus tenuis]|uniref:Lariat debranching enzyme C-terminal domain-containing protein n=1 Tax=Parelaphostrongylus tenuis TaxID=148309 RepID=A0AAD5WFB0_PARTN|nr:hypothetical protein KIN20_029064 [Parelaphostrongylus tenuis]
MVTHDWPAGIVDYGDKNWLLKVKPFFRNDIVCGKLGNPSSMQLLFDIRPRYWLSAHLHVAFAALVPHTGKDGSRSAAPTRFLALDKPIPRRHFVQALEMDVPADVQMKLSYDPQWLVILKLTDSFTSISSSNIYLPSPSNSAERWDFRPTDEELASINNFGDLTIPENFRQTAPPLKENTPESRNAVPTPYYRNPQTAEFCSRFKIADLNKMLAEKNRDNVAIPHYMLEENKTDSNEIVIDDSIFADNEDFVIDTQPTMANLDDFVPPKIVSKSGIAKEDKGDTFVLKRRKVDIPDDDDDDDV